MLTLHSRNIGPAARYFLPCVLSTTAFAQGQSIGTIIFDPTLYTVASQQYRILSQSRKLDRNGNRSCSHFVLDGDVYANAYAFNAGTRVALSQDIPPQVVYLPSVRVKREGSSSVFTACSLSDNYRYSYPGPGKWQGRQTRNFIFEVTKVGDVYHQHWEFEVLYSSWRKTSDDSFIVADWALGKYTTYSVHPSTPGAVGRTFNLERAATPSVDIFVPSLPDKAHAEKLCRTKFGYHPDDHFIWSDLVRRASGDAKFISLNSVEYLRDIPRFLGESKELLKLRKGKITPKKISDLYLSWKYGSRLTYADTVQLTKDAVYAQVAPRAHARAKERVDIDVSLVSGQSSHVREYNYKVYYRIPDFGRDILSELEMYGLLPTPKTMWELLPYSFTVDWFIDITSRMEQYDSRLFYWRHPITGSVYSRKVSVECDPGVFYAPWESLVGSLSLTIYDRIRSDHLDHLPIYFDSNPTRKFNNFAELTALLISGGSRR